MIKEYYELTSNLLNLKTKNMIILVTGAAGFIGFSLCNKLLESQDEVIGIDNLNSYYDVKLKEARVEKLREKASNLRKKFLFLKQDLDNKEVVLDLFKKYKPNFVVHLAAQAGVRYSLENPHAYIQSNIVGFLNILEGCRENPVKNLIYASSSSVYGGNLKMPFSEKNGVDHPVSLYAATKKSNELMAHCYSSLYGIPSIGLRFFTVYGPWGRPDMALFLFTKSIIERKPINVFNNGKMLRDFTYIDDIVESITLLIKKPPKGELNFDKLNPDPSTSWAPFRVFNIGNSNPVSLMEYIYALEETLSTKAELKYLPMQPGDVEATHADTSFLENYVGFKPKTSIKVGIGKFVQWYKDYYQIL